MIVQPVSQRWWFNRGMTWLSLSELRVPGESDDSWETRGNMKRAREKIAYTLRSRRFFFYIFKGLSNDGFSTLCAQCVFVDHLESTWLEVVPPTENGIFIGLQENVTENVQILRFLFMPTLMTRPVFCCLCWTLTSVLAGSPGGSLWEEPGEHDLSPNEPHHDSWAKGTCLFLLLRPTASRYLLMYEVAALVFHCLWEVCLSVHITVNPWSFTLYNNSNL